MNNEFTRFLGIDYGSIRIGLSLSDPLKIIASGFKTIPNNEDTISEILKIISEQNVIKVIIGKPLNLKGESGGKADEVNEFILNLKKNTELEIIQIDERFTSVMAQRSIIDMGTKKKKRQNNKGRVDEIAAAILLQSYLDSQR